MTWSMLISSLAENAENYNRFIWLVKPLACSNQVKFDSQVMSGWVEKLLMRPRWLWNWKAHARNQRGDSPYDLAAAGRGVAAATHRQQQCVEPVMIIAAGASYSRSDQFSPVPCSCKRRIRPCSTRWMMGRESVVSRSLQPRSARAGRH